MTPWVQLFLAWPSSARPASLHRAEHLLTAQPRPHHSAALMRAPLALSTADVSDHPVGGLAAVKSSNMLLPALSACPVPLQDPYAQGFGDQCTLLAQTAATSALMELLPKYAANLQAFWRQCRRCPGNEDLQTLGSSLLRQLQWCPGSMSLLNWQKARLLEAAQRALSRAASCCGP